MKAKCTLKESKVKHEIASRKKKWIINEKWVKKITITKERNDYNRI